jgi:hypothetical protein
MKTYLLSALSLLFVFDGFADTLVFSKGNEITGNVIQTNGEDLLVLTDYGTFNFAKANIKEIKPDQVAEASEIQLTNRLPNFRTTVLALNHQTWASIYSGDGD